MATQQRRSGCFKFGCFGCLGLVAIVVVILVAIAALGLVASRGDAKFEAAELAQDLPTLERTVPDELTDDTRDLAFPQADYSVPPEQIGAVHLDFSMGKLEIVAGDPGQPIRVEGPYDSKHFRLKAEFQTHDDGSWRYDLSFSSRARFLPLFTDEGNTNRIRLIIPRGTPFALRGEIGVGQSDLQLGGLWITDIDLDMGTGEHAIGFDEPLAAPLQRFNLDGGIGELRVGRLGNASPARADVDHDIGEMTLDLRGAWQGDAAVALSCGIGECTVRVPDQASIKMGRSGSGVLIGESNDSLLDRLPPPGTAGLPTIDLRVSAKIGELNYSR